MTSMRMCLILRKFLICEFELLRAWFFDYFEIADYECEVGSLRLIGLFEVNKNVLWKIFIIGQKNHRFLRTIKIHNFSISMYSITYPFNFTVMQSIYYFLL